VEASHFGLTARCRLESTSKEERALRVVARLEIGEEEPLTEERPDVVVPPGETLDVPIPFERTGHPDEATCRCQAIPAEPP
jgi:hypothetical protein